MKKILLTSTFASMLCALFIFGMLFNVLAADNDAVQEASTSQATTISVVGKVADTAITSITFPQGAPGATISNPYNNVDTVTDSQVLDASTSEPVVRLKNNAGLDYNVTLEITDWTNDIVASEQYELVPVASTNITAVTATLSANGDAASVDTAESVTSGGYKALYLQLILSGVADKTGTSTLTVLGESV